MSDNDTTEDNVSEETVEFSQSHFDEPADDTSETTEAPAEPATDKVETPETDAETPAEEPDKPADSKDAPDEEKPEAPTDEQAVDLKGMSKAERAAYFQSLKQEQTREVAEVVNQNYQPQNVTDLQQAYIDAGYSDGEALMLARQDIAEQKAQIAEATTEIAELNANLRVDSIEAQATYDWMNPAKADSYDKDLHDLTAQIFSQGVTTDPRTGQIIGARMTPKQAADIVDKIRNSGTAKAQLAAQKAAEAQLAAVAPPTSTAPPSSTATADDKQASGLERALGNIR